MEGFGGGFASSCLEEEEGEPDLSLSLDLCPSRSFDLCLGLSLLSLDLSLDRDLVSSDLSREDFLFAEVVLDGGFFLLLLLLRLLRLLRVLPKHKHKQGFGIEIETVVSVVSTKERQIQRKR